MSTTTYTEYAVTNTTTGKHVEAGHSLPGVPFDCKVFGSEETARIVLRSHELYKKKLAQSAMRQRDDLAKAVKNGDLLAINNASTYDITRYWGENWDDPASIALAQYKIVTREVTDWELVE